MQPNPWSVRRIQEEESSSSDMRQANEVSHEVVSILGSALQVGGLTGRNLCLIYGSDFGFGIFLENFFFRGISGLLVGGAAGLLRSTTPAIFALASAIQWFALGSTFWAARGSILHMWGNDAITARDKIYASSMAGCIGGCAGGFLRGRRNILPGAVAFALFGATGQVIYNMADNRRTSFPISGSKTAGGSRWLNSRWSPVKVLSDDEYATMLEEKLLRVKAEIALVEENIFSLQNQLSVKR